MKSLIGSFILILILAGCENIVPEVESISDLQSSSTFPAPMLSIGNPSLAFVNATDMNSISLTYSGAFSSSLVISDISLSLTGSASCNTVLNKISSYPIAESYELILSNCVGSGTVQILSVAAGKALNIVSVPDSGGGASSLVTVDNLVPSSFSISGIVGGSDSIVDDNLNSTLFPTIQWSSSANALSYLVTVFEDDNTTVKCATIGTAATSYNFSSCALTAGLQYKVKVEAVRYINTIAAVNNLYAFRVNRPPTTLADTYFVNRNGGSQNFHSAAATPQSNDFDPDGDTLFVSSVSAASHGTVNLSAGAISYSPNFDFHGTDSFSYTIQDSKGAEATGTINVKVVGNGTWLGTLSNAWSLPGNWCGGAATNLASCNAGTTPTTGSIVLFDDICSPNCSSNLSSPVTIAGLRLGSQYTGTLSILSFSLTLNGVSGFYQAGGAFVGGTGNLSINSGPLILVGGMMTAPSNLLTVSGMVNFSGSSVFNHNNGSFKMATSVIGTATHTFTNSPIFYNFILGGTGSHSGHSFSGGQVSILNNFFLDAGNLGKKFNSGTILFYGPNLSNVASKYGYGGNGLIKFVGTGNQTFTSDRNPLVLPSIEVSNTGGIVSFSGYNVIFDGNFLYTSGAVDFTFTTVSFGDPAYPINQNTTIATGNIQFYNVNFSGSSNPNIYSRLIVGYLDVYNTLNFQSPTLGDKINGGKIRAYGDVNFLNAGALGTTGIEFAGSFAQTLSQTGTQFLGGLIEVNKTASILTISTNLNLAAAGQDFAIISGSVSLNGNLNVSDSLSLASGTFLNQNFNSISYGTLINNGTILP